MLLIKQRLEISGDITLDNEGASTIGESKVLSSMILNDEIVDADVNNDAAILGTKIKPNFGIKMFPLKVLLMQEQLPLQLLQV
jgi:hypothetical protein